MSSLGIDFGTTNSVLASFDRGVTETQPIDVPKDLEWSTMGFDRVLPSVFARGANGEPLFGWAAKLSSGEKSQAVKRLLATEEKVSVDGEDYLVEEIVSLLFGAIKQGAAAHAGIDLRRAVVTVPANSRGLARLRTKVCANMVGIEVPVLINEPTAAAMAYGLRAAVDQNVLVVDWGGGTLDVTLLQVADNVFVEQASKGVGKLGGIDVDKLMFQQLTQDLPEAATWTHAEIADAVLEIEKAKVRLSDNDATSVALPRGQRKEITRFRFNEWIEPLIQRLLVPVRTVVAEGLALGTPVDVVLLVGGSCKIPVVREAIAAEVGREPLRGAVDPMTAIAEGAAIAAAILDGTHDGDFFVGTEHALGTVALDGQGGLRFSEILPRNMKLPAKGSDHFYPVTDMQETVLMQVVEGDATKPLDHEDNVQLDEWKIPLVPRLVSESRIEIEYSYDVSGLLHVKVIDGVDDRILHEADVQSMTGHDPRALVQMAQHVESILEDSTAPTPAPSLVADLPPEVELLLDRARAKVAPFVPDGDAQEIRALADALETASATGEYQAEKVALDSALQRYSYLF